MTEAAEMQPVIKLLYFSLTVKRNQQDENSLFQTPKQVCFFFFAAAADNTHSFKQN